MAERRGEMQFNPLVKIAEYPAIVARGVLSTPGLVVDGVVKSQGHVPTVAAIRDLLR